MARSGRLTNSLLEIWINMKPEEQKDGNSKTYPYIVFQSSF